MNSGEVVIDLKLNTKTFEVQIAETEAELSAMVEEYEIISKAKPFKQQEEMLRQYRIDIEKTNNKLLSLKKAQQEVEKLKSGEVLKQMGSGIEDIIKKMGKWTLALFGIRTAYNFIRKTISQIVEEDDALKSKMEYITYAIGVVLKPLAEFLINVVYKLVAGLGAIIKAITGINIFADATAQNFNKANNNAKQLKKTLAGFDELNILNENGTVGLGYKFQLDIPELPDLVDDYSQKIKTWFLGEGYETITDSIIGNIKKLPQAFKEAFKPWYYGIFKPFVITPIQMGIDALRPIWEPVVEKWKETFSLVKLYWDEFIELITPNIINPIKEKWDRFKKDILNSFAPFINTIIDGINYAFGIFGIKLDRIEIETSESADTIESEIENAIDNVNNLDFTDKNLTINVNTNTKNAQSGFSSFFDNIKKDFENIFSYATAPFKFAFSGLFGAKGLIYSPNLLPKLAVGGIVNMPGRGIPYRGATIGERGAEAVVPLTDSQQMEYLGEAIGKYITVNLTNITELDGRTIARKVTEVNNNTDFLMNR